MADRAALAAQEVNNNADPASQWQQFTDKTFERVDTSWVVKADASAAMGQYIASVKTGLTEIEQIAKVFQEVAPEISDQKEVTPVLRRFLTHEAAPAFVYHTQLQSRLHPGMEQLEEQFQEQLVRTRTGSYVIRPTRRAQVERRLEFIEKLQRPLAVSKRNWQRGPRRSSKGTSYMIGLQPRCECPSSPDMSCLITSPKIRT